MKTTLLLFGTILLAACNDHKCPEDEQVHISISKDKENRIGWETTYVKKTTDTLQDMTITLPRMPKPSPPPTNFNDSGPGSPPDTLFVKVRTTKSKLKKDDDD
jgi:hypothetical protein